MKITLLKVDGKEYAVCVDAIPFVIEHNQPQHNESCKAGMSYTGKAKEYYDAYDEAQEAYKLKIYDSIEEN